MTNITKLASDLRIMENEANWGIGQVDIQGTTRPALFRNTEYQPWNVARECLKIVEVLERFAGEGQQLTDTKHLNTMYERLNAEIERIQQIIEEGLYDEYSIHDFKVDLEMLEGIRDGNK